MAKHPAHRLLHVMQHNDDSWHVVWGTARWQPRVDVYRNEEAVLVQVEAPGIAEQDLRLHFEPGQLVIEGQRERPPITTPTRCLHMEIEYGASRRAIALPPDADGEHIVARYQAGILQVSVPIKKPTPPQTVRVAIS